MALQQRVGAYLGSIIQDAVIYISRRFNKDIEWLSILPCMIFFRIFSHYQMPQVFSHFYHLQSGS